ncbi:MAG: hypothetical protein QNI90_02975 [Dinoroseobacter sp.]|nr:hypothetical protein [Dinoroseobacter sp.]
MLTFVVCFRLKEDASYQERYESLVNAINEEAQGITGWDELTSVIILKSTKSRNNIATNIVAKSRFDMSNDLLLVVNASAGSVSVRGDISDSSKLKAMFQRNRLESLMIQPR